MTRTNLRLSPIYECDDIRSCKCQIASEVCLAPKRRQDSAHSRMGRLPIVVEGVEPSPSISGQVRHLSPLPCRCTSGIAPSSKFLTFRLSDFLYPGTGVVEE